MINCFPEMYEDELLYSVVSRYRRMCGLISKNNISKDFYDKEQGIFQMLFPLHLNEMSKRLPCSSQITGEQLLLEHTMYPFFTKFLSYELCEDIKESMLNRENANVFAKFGFSGSRVRVNSYLKYCHLCVKEDIGSLGESYWRREHQFLGVFFCSKHRIKLQESKVRCKESNNEYICLDDIEISNFDTLDNNYLEYNLKYIYLMKELISNDSKKLELSEINKFYIYKLQQIGLASKNGSVYNKKLLSTFKDFYPQKYLKLMQSDFEIVDKCSWLKRFLTNNNRNKSIVYHLLMIQFLNSSVAEVFDSAKNIKIKKVSREYTPIFNLEERKKVWIKIIKDNPNKSRSELKSIGKGLHTYIYRYDKEWYNAVTPKYKRKERKTTVDWNKKDMEILEKVKMAVNNIRNSGGRPVRVCNSSIIRECGLSRTINNSKLVKTRKFIEEVAESNEEYWKRKIEWGIETLKEKGENITRYKIQLKCGFGGICSEEIKKLIEEIINYG